MIKKIKKLEVFLVVILMSFVAQAQKPVAILNHIQFDVHDINKSVAFYTKVLGMDTISCPFPQTSKGHNRWLKSGTTELHLWQNIPDTIKFEHVFHLGFMVPSIDDFIKKLYRESNEYRTGKYKQPDMDKMPYGAKSTFIRDPDGNWIHIIEAQKRKRK